MAFGFGSKAKGTAPLLRANESQNLATLIRSIPEDQSGIYVHALELLDSMQASPSCHRMATSTLLDSCQSIDGSKQEAEASLDDTRSIYAAQLAVCEIQSAESKVPPSCESLSSHRKTSLFNIIESQTSRKTYLTQCLQALETRPQWWTSYSNNRQNAVVICQAARADIEKDVLIKSQKASIQINHDADATLAKAVEYSQDALRRQHDDFVVVKQALHDQLVQEIETAAGRVQVFFENMVKRVDTSVQTILTRVTLATRSIEKDVVTLRENVNAANAQTQDLEKNVGKVFQKAAEGTAELASIQTRQLNESNDLAINLRTSLQQMNEYEVHNLVMVVREMYGKMQSNNDLIVSMSARQDDVDSQMNRLGQLMVGLQAHAQTLQDAQYRQEITQTRLHNAMEAGLNASLAQISVIQKSAISLQTALHDACQSISHITSLAMIASKIWTWGPVAAIVGTLMLAAFRYDARFASIIAAAIGVVIFVRCAAAFLLDLAYEHSTRHPSFPLEHLLLFGFVIGLLISIGLFYRQSSKSSGTRMVNCASTEHRIRRMWRV